jgi:prolyl-tRNA synthetase
MEVNETKLANAVRARELRPATEAEIRAVGATPGYASPVGLKDVLVVADELVTRAPNLVAGANDEGYHLTGTNYDRDWSAQVVADLGSARAGDACPECGASLRAERGVEVANIFQLGTRYADAFGATFWDSDGQQKPLVMGSYGIGLGRLLACIAEEHHDEKGLIWPASVAPYPLHLVQVASKTTAIEPIAAKLYDDLVSAGIEPLFDVRPESAGVKFNDADLIGLPLRLTVGERSLKNGGVELKLRESGEMRIVALEDVILEVKRMLAGLG